MPLLVYNIGFHQCLRYARSILPVLEESRSRKRFGMSRYSYTLLCCEQLQKEMGNPQ
jgi:hypothetical protein